MYHTERDAHTLIRKHLHIDTDTHTHTLAHARVHRERANQAIQSDHLHIVDPCWLEVPATEGGFTSPVLDAEVIASTCSTTTGKQTAAASTRNLLTERSGSALGTLGCATRPSFGLALAYADCWITSTPVHERVDPGHEDGLAQQEFVLVIDQTAATRSMAHIRPGRNNSSRGKTARMCQQAAVHF